MSQKKEKIISFEDIYSQFQYELDNIIYSLTKKEEITENDTDLKEQLLSILPNGDKLVNLALSIIERSKTVTSHDNELSTEDILKALLNLHLTQIKRSNENIIFAMENAIKLNNLISSNVDDKEKIEDGKNTIASINDTLSSMVNIYSNSINDETVVTIRELLVTNRQADTKYDNNEIKNNKTVTAPVLFDFMNEMKDMIEATNQKIDNTDKTIGTMAQNMSTMNITLKVLNSNIIDTNKSNQTIFQWIGETISTNDRKMSNEIDNVARTIGRIKETTENIKNTMATRKSGL